jgi:hypothetical protein
VCPRGIDFVAGYIEARSGELERFYSAASGDIEYRASSCGQ